MDHRPDEALVAKSLTGDGEAFAALVRRYQDHAYGTAIGILSDFDLARDVVQESFLTAYRDLRKLRDPPLFAGWLRGIVRYTALRALREIDRVRTMAKELGGVPEHRTPQPWPGESAEEAERRDLVHRALEGLTEKNREVVSLHYVDGLSYAEIADFLGVTEATVLGRLQRGRAQLRKELWNVVEETFKQHELPDDFADEVQSLLAAIAEGGWQQQEAANRLAEIGAPAVDPLVEALKDPRPPVRMVAARVLCRIGDARALQPILRLLYSKDWWFHHRLFSKGHVLGIPGVREELLRFLEQGDQHQRYYAIYALAHARHDEEVYGRIVGFFRDEGQERGMRMHAMSAACRLRPDRAPDLIVEALSDPANRRRSGWAWWIAARDGYLVPIDTCLAGFTRDVAPISRTMAGRLVLRHGDEGRALLKDLLRRGTPDQRAVAALTLAPERKPAVFEALKDELLNGYQHRKWQRIVGRTVVRHYAGQLTAWAEAQDSLPEDRPQLIWALAKVRLASGTGNADDLLRYGPPSARAAAVRDLAREKGAAFLRELRACLREGKPRKVAQEAFRQMLRLGEAAEPIAREMLTSQHWTERKAAYALLRRWHRLTPQQQEKGGRDPHIAVRHAAAWHPSYRDAAAWHPKHRKRVHGT